MGNKNNGFWLSISDLMSGLMVIFLFISIAYMREIKGVINSFIYITDGFQDTEQSLYDNLMTEFKNDWRNGMLLLIRKPFLLFSKNQMCYLKGKYTLKPDFE